MKVYLKAIFVSVVNLFAGLYVQAQEAPKFKVSGYLETYYGYDFNAPVDNNRPNFIYSHNRHNEVNVNLGFIKGSYESNNIRANLAIMTGTYSNANMAAEPGVLKNIYEANAGFKLTNKADLWIDAGVFSSHIGFESAISKDCWTLTRNIASENTPFFESGAKITYGTDNGKFTVAALYLNGWQRITRQNGNSMPSGGIQAIFKPSNTVTFNYSNYIGTEGMDALRVTRIYHNLYGIFQISHRFGVTVGLDYGTQQKSKENKDKNEIFSPVFIAQYLFNPKWRLAGRMEYYKDKHGMLIVPETASGFETTGYSLNIDYAPIENAVLRLEGKVYADKNKVFVRGLNQVNYNAAVTASIAVSFL